MPTGHARRSAAFVMALMTVAACGTSSQSLAPSDATSPIATAPARTPAGVSPSPAATRASPTTGSDVSDWRWEDAGELNTARTGPHAILLGDRRVLVVGGEWFPDSGESLEPGTAELWDPATGGWQRTEGLPKARTDFAAVPLRDGRALVVGGTNADRQSYSSAYAYDPGREAWSKVGVMDKARTSPAAAVLPDGRVLVAGGYFVDDPDQGDRSSPDVVLAAYRPAAADRPDAAPAEPSPDIRLADVDVPVFAAAMATAELFDPQTGEWTPTGSLKFARYGAAAVTLSDGSVLIVGSGDGSGVEIDPRAFDNAEIYDPSTGRFRLAGEMPPIDRSAVADLGVQLPEGDGAPGANGTLVALDDGGALLVGHTHWWKHEGEITRTFRFDPDADAWSEADEPFALAEDHDNDTVSITPGEQRLGAAIARLADGRILVAGGGAGYQSVMVVSESAEAFDPATTTWSPVAAMPTAREGGTAIVIADGSILVVGETPSYSEEGDPTDAQPAVRFGPAP